MSRKRPAPGTSPVGYGQPQQMPNTYIPANQSLTDDQFFNWGANGQDPGNFPNQPVYNMPPNSYASQAAPQPQNQANQIARRPMNQAVTRPNAQWTNDQQAVSVQQNQEQAGEYRDDIDELVAKAQVAKKDAQSKRKQIPPFVLKLHSFLENPKNTDLIRWSADGKSFIVLNEDEFANKLIPELFKHNNYASFVRQLNMYGFHKKVGLSDNSMRASERKAKSPSEYWNPYFRKGYPDLLWLIQKPKNQTTNSKKPRGKSEEHDEDEDYAEEMNPPNQLPSRPQLTIGQTDEDAKSALTPAQFSDVQKQLSMIRRQQSQIAQMLGQLKSEHDALVNQASDYQNKHSRHEQSINAILTFLATLYNRTLQNHEGAQDVAKAFANTLTQDKSGVVDVDNLTFDFPESSINQSQQPYKRQRLMITDGSEGGRANTVSPSTTASPLPRASRRSSNMPRSPQSAHVEEIFDQDLNQQHYPASGQQNQDMMSLIHNTNARNSGQNTPVPDLSHVLNDLENTGATTPAQRENMLRIFNNQSKRPQSGDKTLVSPQRPASRQAQFDSKLASTKQDLDHLAHLQAQQEKSVENLTNLLQPLSPTGSIPGLGDGQDIPPPPLDIDAFLGNYDYFTDANNDNHANGGPMDFGDLNSNAYNNNAQYGFTDDDPLFEDVDDDKNANNNFLDVNAYNGQNDGGRIESVASSSEAPTPKNNGSPVGEWEGGQNLKRRKF